MLSQSAVSQAKEEKKQPPVPGPMLSQGTVDFATPEFTLTLVRSSQTIAALKPRGADDFDFTPGDLLTARSHDGYFHVGDVTLRLRKGGSGDWKNFSTAAARNPVTALPASADVLASADLAPTLPTDIPFQITRTWAIEAGKLALRFTLKNKSTEAVQVGALGFPLIFNNVLNDRSLEEAHAAAIAAGIRARRAAARRETTGAVLDHELVIAAAQFSRDRRPIFNCKLSTSSGLSRGWAHTQRPRAVLRRRGRHYFPLGNSPLAGR